MAISLQPRPRQSSHRSMIYREGLWTERCDYTNHSITVIFPL